MPNNKLNDDLFTAPVFQLPYPAQPYRADTDPQSKEFPSLTKQADLEAADINYIVDQFLRTGVLQNDGRAMYGDVSNLPDYQTALQIVIDANDAFDALPAQTRKRFDNDPAVMFEFLADPDNRSEAERLGLVIPAPKERPQEAGDEGVVGNPPVGSKTESMPKKTAPTGAE